jgi:methionyl-tRNA synthetase
MSKKQAAAQQQAGGAKAALGQPNKADDADGAGLISIDDVFKVELKTAVVLEAVTVEGSDKLLKLQIDLGSEQRQLVAGIAKFYAPDDMVGKRIVVVANLKPAMIFGVESQGMLLAAKKGKKLTLVTTDDPEFKPGAKVS